MAEFEWKTADDMKQEERLNELNTMAIEEEKVQRQMLDEFLIKQAEDYILSEDVSDEEKEKWSLVFEPFRVGVHYSVGKKVRFEGLVYEVIQEHTSQADWTPDRVPALFRVYLQGQTDEGHPVVHEWVQPLGAHDSYQTGDLVSFNGIIYESTVDGNVWSPDTYGWTVIE